jgi:hypothetical protein
MHVQTTQETEDDEAFAGMDTVTWWNMTRLIPIRPYVSYCTAPRVPFASAAAYDKALDVFLRTYTRFVRDTTASWMSFPGSVSRLVWTRRDMLLNGLADFDEMHEDGLRIVRDLTQHNGRAWCLHVNHALISMLSCAARSYSRAYSTIYIWNDEESIKMFSISLQNELVTTIHENMRLFDPLFQANFVLWHDSRSRLLAVLTNEQAACMVLAFLMGTHARLGASSLVNTLEADVAYDILHPLLLHGGLAAS